MNEQVECLPQLRALLIFWRGMSIATALSSFPATCVSLLILRLGVVKRFLNVNFSCLLKNKLFDNNVIYWQKSCKYIKLY